MHIPDGLLAPTVWAPLAGVSAGALALSVRRANQTLAERKIPLMGCMGAFVFAAQMINIPVYAGTSGHLVGSALLAVIFGPAVACIVMSCILIIQALVFGDGGVTALGANIFNMAVVSPFLAYAVYRLATGLWRTRRGRWTGAFVGAWFGTVAGAAVAGVEVGLSPHLPLIPAVAFMTGYHVIIGVFEGLITATAVVAIRGLTPASELDFVGDRGLTTAASEATPAGAPTGGAS